MELSIKQQGYLKEYFMGYSDITLIRLHQHFMDCVDSGYHRQAPGAGSPEAQNRGNRSWGRNRGWTIQPRLRRLVRITFRFLELIQDKVNIYKSVAKR